MALASISSRSKPAPGCGRQSPGHIGAHGPIGRNAVRVRAEACRSCHPRSACPIMGRSARLRRRASARDGCCAARHDRPAHAPSHGWHRKGRSGRWHRAPSGRRAACSAHGSGRDRDRRGYSRRQWRSGAPGCLHWAPCAAPRPVPARSAHGQRSDGSSTVRAGKRRSSDSPIRHCRHSGKTPPPPAHRPGRPGSPARPWPCARPALSGSDACRRLSPPAEK